MLSKENRLVKKTDFSEVRNLGRKYFNPLFTVMILEKNNEDAPQFGFIVTNRLSKKATERNSTRRVLRQVIRLLLPRIKKGQRLVFWAKKILTKQESRTIGSEIEKIFFQAKILNDKTISS